eukprot:5932887-Heterocapsa_arctica.AAC.1
MRRRSRASSPLVQVLLRNRKQASNASNASPGTATVAQSQASNASNASPDTTNVDVRMEDKMDRPNDPGGASSTAPLIII